MNNPRKLFAFLPRYINWIIIVVIIFILGIQNSGIAVVEENPNIKVKNSLIQTSHSGIVADAGQNRKVTIGEEFILDASRSFHPEGGLLTFVWDLDDGTIKEGIQVTHTYEFANTYTVMLIVSDGESEIIDTVTIFVKEVEK